MINGTYVLLFSPRHAQSIDGGFLTGYRSLEDGRRTNTQMRIPVSIITDRVAMGWRQNEQVLSEAPDLPLPSQMY